MGGSWIWGNFYLFLYTLVYFKNKWTWVFLKKALGKANRTVSEVKSFFYFRIFSSSPYVKAAQSSLTRFLWFQWKALQVYLGDPTAVVPRASHCLCWPFLCWPCHCPKLDSYLDIWTREWLPPKWSSCPILALSSSGANHNGFLWPTGESGLPAGWLRPSTQSPCFFF